MFSAACLRSLSFHTILWINNVIHGGVSNLKFAVIPNMTRKNAFDVTSRVLAELKKLGCAAYMESALSLQFADSGAEFFGEAEAIEKCDMVISVGGDGSFINAAKKALVYAKPLLCVNAGKLAYLAAMECDELSLLKNVADGDFVTENRMLLDASVIDKNGEIIYHSNCINDAVVSRSGSIRIMKLSLYCNGAPLIEYMADGAIISTPTGSTAYSLSAGGPVVEPCVESVLVTPVCPHSMFSRSIILDGSSVLTAYHDNSGEAILSCDGGTAVLVPEGARVEVKRAAEHITLVKVKNDTFIDILNKKISV